MEKDLNKNLSCAFPLSCVGSESEPIYGHLIGVIEPVFARSHGIYYIMIIIHYYFTFVGFRNNYFFSHTNPYILNVTQ